MTEIAPESVDGAYTDTIVNDGVDLAKYRAVVRGDVVRTKLEDKLVADATKPGPQREAAEIYLSKATADLPDEAVKVRHILFSPKDDPSAASGREIPRDRPVVGPGQARRRRGLRQAQGRPRRVRRRSPARPATRRAPVAPTAPAACSTRTSATTSNYVPSFSRPILDAKAADDQILAPIKTEFGYHIVQVLNHAPDLAKVKQQVDGGADFADLARELSEGPEADQGGDLGWIAKGQLEQQLIDAIFAAQVGKTSDVVTVAEDGDYLFHVADEEERTPEGRQLEEIRSRVFGDWYQPKKDAVAIERDETVTTPAPAG